MRRLASLERRQHPRARVPDVSFEEVIAFAQNHPQLPIVIGGAAGAVLFIPLLDGFAAPDLVFVSVLCCSVGGAGLLWVSGERVAAGLASGLVTLAGFALLAAAMAGDEATALCPPCIGPSEAAASLAITGAGGRWPAAERRRGSASGDEELR